ncbi:HlyD family secretion protein [Cognatitamlana onchidii]|uniref:HlyD family secretion protein n=1 Tax=Cognatitamlana onchidii TaxID=2562860 RepID=UPI0014561D16|nr:HlyD family secretion protein [Algibacter onchidii]
METSKSGEEKSPKHNTQDSQEEEPKGKSSIKQVTYIVLGVSVLFFIWYIFSERYTPYTDQARVNGLITPITSRVSGNVVSLNIDLHSEVKLGDTLIQLDRKPFEIALKKAEANIDKATQSVAASSSSVKSAAGRLGVAKAQLDRAQRNWDRVQKVLKDNAGALSAADKDQSETALIQALEQVSSAEANLERAKQSLGDSGPGNPNIRGAIQDFEKAKLDLEFATIVAPSSGVIESFDIDLGYYASVGQPLTTLISDTNIWIQADMKENNLSRMHVGDKVKFTFDIAPGKVFIGKVSSLGHGVAADAANKGGLPSIDSKNSWLRDPQRFPIIIGIDDSHELRRIIRIGGQADVVVFTSNNALLNAIASLRIRLNSWLSYVR